MRSASDERLVARVRAGDVRAFEAIYDRYEPPIHSFCRHLLGRPEDADDAVQHTFLAAYRGIRGSEREIDLRPWLYTIARNRCVSLLRGRHREPVLGHERVEVRTDGLTVAVERREMLRDLLADIARLPDDQRAALILTQLQTLTHDEVARVLEGAAVLEVPPDKVKALVFQARSSLLSTRAARETACHDIREQLSTLTGPALRRATLKRHIRACAGCRDFALAMRRQRAAIALVLPVAVRSGFKHNLLGRIAGGSGGGGAGSAGTAGGLLAKGIALKLGVAATLAVTGAGVAVIGLDATRVGRARAESVGHTRGAAPAAVSRTPTAIQRLAGSHTHHGAPRGPPVVDHTRSHLRPRSGQRTSPTPKKAQPPTPPRSANASPSQPHAAAGTP